MDTRYSVNPKDVRRYTTEELRNEFHISGLFKPGEVTTTYSHVDRMVVMGICPTTRALILPSSKALGVAYFLQRREMGLLNIGGGEAVVTADGTACTVPVHTALYLGKGIKEVTFAAKDAVNPPKLYALSCPAHKPCPSMLIPPEKAVQQRIGSALTSNERVINKYLHEDVLETCQLALGMTVLAPGSVWNTMPVHTHERRMEVYLYFGLPEDGIVFHYMGEPQETRHIVMRNEEAVISPSWSIHSGCGTASYTFVWGMCGENQTYDDMDHVKSPDIR